ncbi:MAG: hypothetical protein RMJ82_04920 [Gemmatales bacterium]|nr:hypothetical protein [Gemmatales bacterium]
MPGLRNSCTWCCLIPWLGLTCCLSSTSVGLAQAPSFPYPAPSNPPSLQEAATPRSRPASGKPTAVPLWDGLPSSMLPFSEPSGLTAATNAQVPGASASETGQERGCVLCERAGGSCLDRIRALFHGGRAHSCDDFPSDTHLLSPTEARWRLWKHHERPCKHPICAYPHLFLPFEVYGRMSVVWLVGGGKLDRTLDPGIGAEIGVRQFLYDETKPAAWFGELGFEFTYHNGGEDHDLPIFTIREWNVYWVRLALGREWYFGGGQPGDWTFVVGVFSGGRFGSANTKFLDEPYRTDNIGGIFAGGHAGILIPRCGYDLLAEIFTEYGHDWTSWSDLITTDRHIDHIKLGGAIGIRY